MKQATKVKTMIALAAMLGLAAYPLLSEPANAAGAGAGAGAGA